ncbi:MAG: hypothetical protein C4326_05790 [Ignavibacteria bacterium]
MRTIRYRKDVDALRVQLSDKKIDYAEEEGQLIIHFSKDNEPVLVEILDAKEFLLSSLSSIIKEKEVGIPSLVPNGQEYGKQATEFSALDCLKMARQCIRT